ncbi:MAG TPA: hypothetical protein VFP68_22620 [Burkholderiaceae bacterium]|nr:hypothetical protein [Burkholderiaceae bacterium]
MEYVHQRGSFDDVPLQRLAADFEAAYPGLCGSEIREASFDADVEREAQRER